MQGLTKTALILTLPLLFFCMRYNYVKHTPIAALHDIDHTYTEKPELMTGRPNEAMISILIKHDELYEIRDDELYISQQLASDKNLLANYTEKAETIVDNNSQ